MSTETKQQTTEAPATEQKNLINTWGEEAKVKMADQSGLGNNLVMRGYSVVLAVDDDQDKDGFAGIGLQGALPWKIPSDMQHFKDVTSKVVAKEGKQNAVIMGRKTWESIPAKFRPLPGRLNIILTRDTKYTSGDDASLVVNGDLAAALTLLATEAKYLSTIEKVFVIGGAEIYKQSLDAAGPCATHCQSVYLTRLQRQTKAAVPCDVKVDLSAIPTNFTMETTKELAICDKTSEGITGATLERWNLKNPEEAQYLDQIRSILKNGAAKGDRTGTGTISQFGAQMRYSLRDGKFPLLTTKRVFWRGVCEELLWFLRGETHAQLLQDKGVHIWDGNGSREFLDSRGLTENDVNDLGPIYGFQWRHFNADYEGAGQCYDGKGVDQIKQIVHTLKTNPNDRRILLTAWNPAKIDKMALPPCHIMAQFYVSPNQELSCMMYQRSCDMGLGVPFNIASYALLTILLAKAAGLKPGDFIHTLGDAHVYSNHVEPLQEQLKRQPRAFPYLVVKKDREFLEDYECGDFEILDYSPYPTIKMEMAV